MRTTHGTTIYRYNYVVDVELLGGHFTDISGSWTPDYSDEKRDDATENTALRVFFNYVKCQQETILKTYLKQENIYESKTNDLIGI